MCKQHNHILHSAIKVKFFPLASLAAGPLAFICGLAFLVASSVARAGWFWQVRMGEKMMQPHTKNAADPSYNFATLALIPAAACDRFQILIHGVGGHAAMPHLTSDPIVASAAMVTGFQTIISRNLR